MARQSRAFADDDIPEMKAADFARAKRLLDAVPKVVDAMKRGRGRPKLMHPKSRVSLQLDPEVVAAYKATGKGWQSQINETLARAVARRKLKRGRNQAA